MSINDSTDHITICLRLNFNPQGLKVWIIGGKIISNNIRQVITNIETNSPSI